MFVFNKPDDLLFDFYRQSPSDSKDKDTIRNILYCRITKQKHKSTNVTLYRHPKNAIGVVAEWSEVWTPVPWPLMV